MNPQSYFYNCSPEYIHSIDPDLRGDVESIIRMLPNPSQITALLDAVKDRKYKTLIRLAIMSGARQGELLGLMWSDVDWKNNQIHIQRTFNKGCFYSTKTQTSNRRVDLGPAMMKELKRRKLIRPEMGDI